MSPIADDDRVDVLRAAVDREFEHAERRLEGAGTATEVGISKATIVNRLHYACFHGAQVPLYVRRLDPQSHSYVQTLLTQELIQTGELDRDFRRIINDMTT